MKYIINYNEQGKILGFTQGKEGLNIEVSNATYIEAQRYNKIIVDGDNITFDKVDWRTPEEIIEQTKREVTSEIQSMLDDKAKELRYDNMMSARSYAGYVNPFQAEAIALAEWCSACWAKAGELEALETIMTVEEVLAEMPIYKGGE